MPARHAPVSISSGRQPRRTRTEDVMEVEEGLLHELERGGRSNGSSSNNHSLTTTADLPRQCAQQCIFPLLQQVRDEVRSTIDTHMDWDELTAIDVNYAVVRPLVRKYGRNSKDRGQDSSSVNLAIIFVFLVNRVQFQRDAERDLALQNVNNTRAALCELVAMKLLRAFAADGLQLITALTYPFSTFQGADEAILRSEDLFDDTTGMANLGPAQCSSALELAIQSQAKKFIKTPLVQRCVAGIYEGRVVVSYQSAHAIVDDSYKKRPLGLYDPATAPFLDHHRLRVPLIRSRVEFCNFVILLVLYVWCLSKKTSPTWTWAETVFTIWTAGFALDEVTQMQEHGVGMYVSSLYNILDLLFCLVSFLWWVLRLCALAASNPEQSALSFEVLAIGAILLCPRVASMLVQDNVILLALKAMLIDFIFFMLLASVCFSGFLYTFWALSGPQWTASKILWIMIKMWLGNSYVGFDVAESISPIFGPPLMVFFAVMANTLLLTILISLLSNTFTVVAQNAVEEAMYQFACKTVSGISSEALIAYAPPLNLLALVIMVPASLVLTPRYLHKANVYLLRLTSWPILLVLRLSLHFSRPPTLDRQSATAYVLGTSSRERSRHLISWLPLPRSRPHHDRDMVQAAFAQSKSERRPSTAVANGRSKMQKSPEREDPAATTPTIDQDDPAFHTNATEAVESATSSSREIGTQSTATTDRALESPLAQLFRRTFRRRGGDDPTNVAYHTIDEAPATVTTSSPLASSSATPHHSSAAKVAEGRLIEIEDEADPDEPLAVTSAEEDQDDAGNTTVGEEGMLSHSTEELLPRANSTHHLLVSLTRRIEQQDARQRRIEEMLTTLLNQQQ